MKEIINLFVNESLCSVVRIFNLPEWIPRPPSDSNFLRVVATMTGNVIVEIWLHFCGDFAF